MDRIGRRQALALVLVTALAGCGGMQIDDFTGSNRPDLVLEEFFAGPVEGWGVMQSRFGTLQRQFTIEARGSWDERERTLQLVETYRFDDGQEDRLEWRLTRVDERRYVGTEPHVVGEAEGEQAGNAFHWTYTRDVPGEDGSTRLGFDDWFWLQPGGVLISRASVTKLGIEVATLSVFYRRPGAEAEPRPSAGRSP